MHTNFKALPLMGLAALALGAAAAKPAAAQFTITANITGPPPSATANADVQNALNFLASDFTTNGTAAFNLTANVTWEDLGFSATNGYTLGGSSASAASYQTVTGASVNDTVDSSVLLINPLDRYLNGAASTVNTTNGYADFTISLNNNAGVPWDYTLGKPSDPNAISLASTMYHEAIHSMGFAAFNRADGSYDFSTDQGQGSLAPTLWDTKLYDGTTKKGFTSDTQDQRQAVEVSGDAGDVGSQLFFAGTNATAVNGGQFVQMSAPSTFVGGSSDGSHIDPNQADGPTTGDAIGGLLYPATGGGVYNIPSTLELSMLSDIGWKTASPAAVPEASTTISFSLLLALGMGGVVIARKKSAKA